MIEIYLLEQLDAFARHGTSSAAAQALHTSQPSMTRAMQKLEDELGVALFIHCPSAFAHLCLRLFLRRSSIVFLKE